MNVNKLKTLAWIILLYFLWMLPLLVNGATQNWYAAPGASDANAGTSVGTAAGIKKFFAKKDYTDGDDIIVWLLSGTYTGTNHNGVTKLFFETGAGTTGRLTFKPYQGAKVIFDMRGITYHNTSYNASSAKWANGRVTWDGVIFTDSSLTARTAQETNEAGESEFFNGGNRSPESSAPNGSSFAENAIYRNCIWLNTLQALGGSVWNKVENNLFQFVGRNPFEHGLYIGWNFSGYNPVIRSNIFAVVSGHAIKISSGGQDLTITDNFILDNRETVPGTLTGSSGQYTSGIYFGNDASSLANNLVISNNYISVSPGVPQQSLNYGQIVRGIMLDGMLGNTVKIRNNRIIARHNGLYVQGSGTFVIDLTYQNNTLANIIDWQGNLGAGREFIRFGSSVNSLNFIGSVNLTPNVYNKYTLDGTWKLNPPAGVFIPMAFYNNNYKSLDSWKSETSSDGAAFDSTVPGISDTGSNPLGSDVTELYYQTGNPTGLMLVHNYTSQSPSKVVPLPSGQNTVWCFQHYQATNIVCFTNFNGNDTAILPMDSTTWPAGGGILGAINQVSLATKLPKLGVFYIRKLPEKNSLLTSTITTTTNRKLDFTLASGSDYSKRNIYRRVNNGSWSLLTTINDTTTIQYNDNTANQTDTFDYRITQANDFGESLYTDSVNLPSQLGGSPPVPMYATTGKIHSF